MLIDKIIIMELQALYQEKFGKPLSEEDARFMLNNIVTLLSVIMDISTLHKAFDNAEKGI